MVVYELKWKVLKSWIRIWYKRKQNIALHVYKVTNKANFHINHPSQIPKMLWLQKSENYHENQRNDKTSLNDLKWPSDDLCGKSWPLITKIIISSDSLTLKSYKKWCHLSFWYFHIFYLFSGSPLFIWNWGQGIW